MSNASPLIPEPKPKWRGWIHAGAFPVALVMGAVLIALAQGRLAKIGAAVFTVCSALLFGLSALYHRFNWSAKATAVLRRIDHANIFLMIAGTYTPIILIVLSGSTRTTVLAVVWGGALVGILFHMFWLSAPRWLYVGLYLVLGWSAVWVLRSLIDASLAGFLLVVLGGLLYTVGAVMYGAKRPNPAPGVFGFHELFHAATVLAFGAQWAAVLLYSTATHG